MIWSKHLDSPTPVVSNGTNCGTEAGNILYTSVTNSSVLARLYDSEAESTETVFETPFREATVDLNSTEAGPHIFYPKTSTVLESFVYEVTNGNLSRVPLDGYSFAAAVAGDTIIASSRTRSGMDTRQYDIETETTTNLSRVLVPEKCLATGGDLYCASETKDSINYQTLNQWFRGVEKFDDSLWHISETNTELVDIKDFSGRQVDVINGTIGAESSDWYFQNKNDNSLWIYELSRTLVAEESVE